MSKRAVFGLIIIYRYHGRAGYQTNRAMATSMNTTTIVATATKRIGTIALHEKVIQQVIKIQSLKTTLRQIFLK